MHIKKIKWLDKENHEAIVMVGDSKYEIICYAYNLKYNIDEEILENLEALKITEVMIVDNNLADEVVMNNLKCKVIGVLCCNKSVLKIGDIFINVKREDIPSDIQDGNKISVSILRVDLW